MANIWDFRIDWDEDGDFDDEDNMASRVIDFYSRRGRKEYLTIEGGFQDWEVSYAEFIVDNEDRKYDPNYTSSSLFPNVSPGKLCRIRVQDGVGGQTYGVIAGTVEDIRPVSTSPNDVKITVRGLEDKLRIPVSVALQEGEYAHTLIGLILTASDYPSVFGSSLNNGADALDYWWIDDKSAKVALFELSTSELGKFYIDRDGQARFKSRDDLGAVQETYTQDQVLKDLGVPMPWDWIRNYVILYVYPRVEQSQSTLWEIGDIPYIRPGEETDWWGEFTHNGEVCPAKSVQTPVSTTDYTLFQNIDGTGSDYTSDLSIETFTVYGTSFYIKVKNNGSYGGYLFTCKVRGNAVSSPSKSTCKSDQSGSADPRKFIMDLIWQQSVIRGKTFADFLANAMKSNVPQPKIKVENRFEKQFGVDKTDLIAVNLSKLDVAEELGIGYIEHTWLEPKNGQSVRTLFHTEPVFDLSDYWYFTTNFTTYFGL